MLVGLQLLLVLVLLLCQTALHVSRGTLRRLPPWAAALASAGIVTVLLVEGNSGLAGSGCRRCWLGGCVSAWPAWSVEGGSACTCWP